MRSTQDELEKLVVGKRRRTRLEKARPQALAMAQVVGRGYFGRGSVARGATAIADIKARRLGFLSRGHAVQERTK